MATMTTTYGNTVNSVFRAYTSGSYTTSDTQYVFSITGGLNIPTKGYKSTRSFTSTVYVGSTSLGSGSIAAATRYGVLTTAIKTVSYTVTRTHSAQTVTFKSILQGSGESTTSTATLASVTVPAKPSYTISYNVNGGTFASGQVSSATKWYNEAYTIQSGTPTRTGYSFAGWNTNSSGTGTTYSAGTSYTTNAALTLYAKWIANTYSIKYYNNTGSGTIFDQTKTYGVNLVLSNGSEFSKQYHSLSGWNTQANGTGTSYALGATYTGNAPLNLYAQWHLDYTPPVITNLDVHRCASASNTSETDDGEFIYVGFTYYGGTINEGETYITPNNSSITIGTITNNITLSSGSGTYSNTFSPYSKDSGWNIIVSIADTTYAISTTARGSVQSATYPIDLISNGDDVYMGVMTPAVIGRTLKIFVDAIYPIGSYYETSDANFDPNTYFGGTWVLEASGQVHVSAGTGYTIGTTGGATTSSTGNHTLTTSEIPAHTHGSKSLSDSFTARRYGTSGAGTAILWGDTTGVVRVTTGSTSQSKINVNGVSGTSTYDTVTIDATHEHTSVGGSEAHNHGSVSTMQPYIVVNRWHRTA